MLFNLLHLNKLFLSVKMLNFWPNPLQPRRMLWALEYRASKYFAFANGKQPCECDCKTRTQHKHHVLQEGSLLHNSPTSALRFLKSACMAWKGTGMNVENRSAVFAKCVEIARPQCGEQEFSVLVAVLRTTELVKNTLQHSSLVGKKKAELLVTECLQQYFVLFHLLLMYTKVSAEVLMT